MTGYVIPSSVHDDFSTFQRQYADFAAGGLDALAFKTIRVPFGIYEQRAPQTFMVRVKLTGGLITPAQLAALAGIARNYANGKIHVTTRGGAQLHDVKVENFLSVIEALHRTGLTGRGGGGNTVRNIVVDPHAGAALDEVFDVTPHALAMTEKMLARKDSYALPRKYKIAFSGSAADRGGACFADVGFIARENGKTRGFRVYLAGGMGAHSRLGAPWLDFLPESEIFLFAQAVKEVFDARGNRKNKHAARLRFLLEDLGEETLRGLIGEKIPEVRARGGWELSLPEAFAPPELDAGPTPAASPEEALWRRRFVTKQKQTGYYSVKLPLALGDLSAEKARALAEALRTAVPFDETIRFASDQNIYLRNLPEAALPGLFPILAAASPQTQKPALLGDVVVCTGAATCQLGITVPRGAQAALEKRLRAAGLDLDALQGFRLNLSGCPNSCGRHEIADLGFFGKASRNDGVLYPAYNVFAGARTGDGIARFARKLGEVAAFHLPRFVQAVLETWLAEKPGYADFADWIDAGGKKIVADLARRFENVPALDDDRNPYFDFQQKEMFSLKGRGAGECSAGMYDLIEADKKALGIALKLPEDTPENLALIRLLAARMLLVTRGEEARGEAEALAAFKKQFLDSGLIDAQYLPLVQGPPQPEVRRLAEAVVALYGTMDNTLKFAGERTREAAAVVSAAAPAERDAEKAHRFKDYRGVACPMNFVKTKMDLAQMQSGQILEILLDDGAPIDNVPQSVQGEGHAVLAQTREGEAWRVRIRKK
jgi:sulfite reductase (ferredoxin)